MIHTVQRYLINFFFFKTYKKVTFSSWLQNFYLKKIQTKKKIFKINNN